MPENEKVYPLKKWNAKKLLPWPENLTTMQMQHPIVSELLKWPGLSHPVTRSGGFTSWTKGNLISTSWRRVSGLTRGEIGQAETLIVYEGKLKSVHFLYSGNDFKYYLDLFKYFQIYSLVHSQPVCYLSLPFDSPFNGKQWRRRTLSPHYKGHGDAA